MFRRIFFRMKLGPIDHMLFMPDRLHLTLLGARQQLKSIRYLLNLPIMALEEYGVSPQAVENGVIFDHLDWHVADFFEPSWGKFGRVWLTRI